jgi:hypothetical protein
MHRSLLLLVLLPSIVQAQFSSLRDITSTAAGPQDMVIADLNGDSLNDLLIVGSKGPKLSWYPALISGGFGAPEVIDRNRIGSGFACDVSDLDGDGDLDIVVTVHQFGINNGALVWYRNEGGGSFGPKRFIGSVDLDTAPRVQAVDVNADGLSELIVSERNVGYDLWLFRNFGNGQFGTAELIDEMNSPQMVLPFDMDGDGDLDLICATEGSGLVWYANDGMGTFGPQQVLPDSPAFVRAVFPTDLDGDGDMDLMIAHNNWGRIEWFKNNGPPDFTLQPIIASDIGDMGRICPSDLDGDGDIDVVVTRGQGWMRWYANDGSGVFGPVQYIDISNIANATAAIAMDTDNDGDMDLLTGHYYDRQVHLFTNNGSGVFALPTPLAAPTTEEPLRSLLADMNGDGVRDVVVVSNGDGKVSWFPADGVGGTGDRRIITTNSVGMRSALALDADGDDDMDIISVTGNGLYMSRNQGTGDFIQRVSLSTISSMYDLANGDIDQDGDEDLLLGIMDADGLKIATGNGDGTFNMPVVDGASISWLMGPMLVDIDGDGDLDAVYGDLNADVLDWQANDGSGTFAPAQLIAGADMTFDDVLLFEDVNGDGMSDLLAGLSSEYRIVWFPNMGNGVFGPEQEAPELNEPRELAIADLDGDGDLDLFANSVAYSDFGAHYALNNGVGVFEPFIHIPNVTGYSNHLIAGDMDGDGDPDLIVTDNVQEEVVWYENYYSSAYRIEGRIYHDLDADGVNDPGEPGAVWYSARCQPLNSTDLTDINGGFIFLVDTGQYVISAFGGGNPLWQISSMPASYEVNVSSVQPVVGDLDIGITAVLDTSVIIPSLTLAAGVCSESVNQWITIRNQGTRIEHGRVELDLDPLLEFNGASPAPDVVNGGHFEWSFDLLGYEELQSIVMDVTRPSAAYIGETANSSLAVLRMDDLDNVTDTFRFEWSEVISCSYDPNDKLVTPTGVGNIGMVDIATPFLEYTIRFQNTGAAPAQDVVLLDPLDPAIDVTRLLPLGYSHQPTRISIGPDRELMIRFEGINLPDSSADPLGSQGYITFRAYLLEQLPHTTNVQNQAFIYFDLNEAVVTNFVVNTLVDCSLHSADFEDLGGGLLIATGGNSYQWYHDGVALPDATGPLHQALFPGYYSVAITNEYWCVAQSAAVFISETGIAEHEVRSLRIVPNPARGQAVVYFPFSITSQSKIEVIDLQGRVISVPFDRGQVMCVLDLSTISSGLYLLRAMSEDGAAQGIRFVVE